MFDPQYFRDHDRYFLSNCSWRRYNILLWPRRCFASRKLMWFKPAFKAAITVRYDMDFVEEARWYSEEYALWFLLSNGERS